MTTKYISTDVEHYHERGKHNNMAIVIDGIIGAGKTSIGNFLSEALDMPLFQELKSDGEASLAQRMLDRFYEDHVRWSAMIQVMFLKDRFNDLLQIEADGGRAILDRSIYGDEIFAKTIYQRGEMTTDEFEIYQQLLKTMIAFVKPPSLLIYLDVSVDTALKRIAKRSRSTEGTQIQRDYLTDLRNQYEDWFAAYELSPKLRVDLNESAFDDDGQIKQTFKEDILSEIRLLSNIGIK